MKKYVAGFLAGAVFTLSAAAFADDIKSLVGKKIQGETVVELNGQALDTAIIVDGKSYAPVRSIGEAAGYDVSMQNKKIILDEKVSNTPTAATPGEETNLDLYKSRLAERINDQKDRITALQKRIEGMEYEMSKPNYVDRGEKAVTDQYKADLEEQQALLANLEAELATLKK